MAEEEEERVKMAKEYANRLNALIDSACEEVKSSIGARLYANSTMMGNRDNLPKSCKDAEIDAIIDEFEGDDEMSSDVKDAMEAAGKGGKIHRKTRKTTRKTRKTRRYSRRR